MRSISKSMAQLTNHPVVAITGILATSIILGIRLFQLVNEKAVNLLFWDQFDFYGPLFNRQGWLDLFLWQHGIHRQGLGGVFTKLVADASHWNGRSESFFILGLVYLTLFLVLLLKFRLSGKFSLTDIVYPLIVLNAYQYEIFIGTTNITPAGLSLFLICLYALCWTIPHLTARYMAVLIINFLAIFSGYSMFLGIVTVFLLLIELARALARSEKQTAILTSGAIVISILSIALFFRGYQVFRSAGCTDIAIKDVLRYPVFIGVMLAKFIGLNYTETGSLAVLAGLTLLMLISIIGLWSLNQFIRKPAPKKQTDLIVFALIGFTLLYCGGAAVGRSCLGMVQAQPSRYVTLMIPAFVGLFLGISTLPRPNLRVGLFAVGLLLVLHSLWPFPSADQWVIDYYYSGKTEWKACYLQEENVESCQKKTGFQVYPVIDNRIQSELDFLKEHKFNLYLDGGITGNPPQSP